jgi:hypothetical protein
MFVVTRNQRAMLLWAIIIVCVTALAWRQHWLV